MSKELYGFKGRAIRIINWNSWVIRYFLSYNIDLSWQAIDLKQFKSIDFEDLGHFYWKELIECRCLFETTTVQINQESKGYIWHLLWSYTLVFLVWVYLISSRTLFCVSARSSVRHSFLCITGGWQRTDGQNVSKCFQIFVHFLCNSSSVFSWVEKMKKTCEMKVKQNKLSN